MAEWYYASNKQQQGPVSLDELKKLARTGVLKPSDLVWKEGMKEWLRASTQDFYADAAGAETVAEGREDGRKSRSRADADDDGPRRSSRRDDDEDDDDDRPRRRKRKPGGMPVGLKVGLIVGGVVVLLIVVGVVLFLALRGGGGGGGGGPVDVPQGMGTFNGFLGPGDPRDPMRHAPCRIYNVRMVAGRTYVINHQSNQFDAFLRLEDSAFRQLAQDDDGGGGLNARIIFRCQRTDNYRVIATMLGGNGRGAYTLIIQEQ